jgi:uncharacterized protein YjbI with pentapeptide repeats
MAAMTEIASAELVRRVLDGERDFSHTRLVADNLDEADGYKEMLAWLRDQDLRANPLSFEGADWRGVRALGLFWERTRMSGIDLSGADLRDANLRGADLQRANLQRTNLSGATLVVARLGGANLRNALLRGADMYECNATDAILQRVDLTGAQLPRATFRGVDFTSAVLTNVNFYKTDLREVRGLMNTRDLGTCSYFRTIVTPAEYEAIWAAITAQPMFDLREE